METSAAASPHAWRDAPRYRFVCDGLQVILGAYLRIRPERLEALPSPPYVVCFNHLNWIDPFVLLAVWPRDRRLFIFGPAEEDMSVGWKNRLLSWPGIPVSFRPGKDDLVDAARRATRVLRRPDVLAIAGEGRLSESERVVEPLNRGPAYFALRARVPIVPVAISGTRWLAWGRTVHVRVGRPIATDGMRPDRATIAWLTAEVHGQLQAMVRDRPERPPPGPVGRWLTELFNDRPWRDEQVAERSVS